MKPWELEIQSLCCRLDLKHLIYSSKMRIYRNSAILTHMYNAMLLVQNCNVPLSVLPRRPM